MPVPRERKAQRVERFDHQVQLRRLDHKVHIFLREPPMTTSSISVMLKCPKCGSAPQTDDGRADDAEVTCSNPDCDATFGTYAEVKAMAVKAAADHAKKAVRDAFRKAGFKT